MSIFTKIAVATGMAGVVGRQSVQSDDAATVKESISERASNPFGRFQEIVDALRQALTRLAEDDFQAYHAIDPDLYCQVTLIEIQPVGTVNASTLNDLLFRINQPAVIAEFIQRELLRDLPMGRFFDFSKFEKLAHLPGELVQEKVEADNDEDADLMRDFGGSDSPIPLAGQYAIMFHWDALRKPQQNALPADAWQLEDAQGTRTVNLVRRDAQHKIVLGLGEGVDIRIDGKFTSSRHAALWFEHGTWWFEDLRSSNGSRVIRHGREDYVFPPRSANLGSAPAVEVGSGSAIFLAANMEGPRAHFPKLTLPSGEGYSVTRNSESPSTPVASSASSAPSPAEAGRAKGAPSYSWDRPPDALLQIADSAGSHRVPVYALALPFRIGRDPEADYKVPQAHTTVSAYHLEIQAIEVNGALLRIMGLNGAKMGNQNLPQNSQMHWTWGSSLVIGTPEKSSCQLTLLRPDAQAQGAMK